MAEFQPRCFFLRNAVTLYRMNLHLTEVHSQCDGDAFCRICTCIGMFFPDLEKICTHRSPRTANFTFNLFCLVSRLFLPSMSESKSVKLKQISTEKLEKREDLQQPLNSGFWMCDMVLWLHSLTLPPEQLSSQGNAWITIAPICNYLNFSMTSQAGH